MPISIKGIGIFLHLFEMMRWPKMESWLLVGVFLADFHAANLSADGLGQLIDEFDDTRVFVGGGHLLDVLLKFLYKVIACLVLPFLTQYHGSLDHHAAHIIGYTCDSTLHNGGVSHQG